MRKLIILIGFLLMVSNNGISGTKLAESPIKIKRAKLDLDILPENKQLIGQLEIKVDKTGSETPLLLLHKSLLVQDILLFDPSNKQNTATPIQFLRKGSKIELLGLPMGVSYLSIFYKGAFNNLTQTTLVDGTMIEGTVRSAINSKGGQLLADGIWYPWVPWVSIDRPGKIELTISLPENYQVIASGRMITSKKVKNKLITSWLVDSHIRRGGCSAFFAKNHILKTRKFGNVTYRVFLDRKNQKWVDKLLEILPKILNAISEVTTAYSEKEFSLVASGLFPSKWGIGKYSGFIIIAGDYFAKLESLNSFGQDFSLYRFLGHEAGHQWFGNMIGEYPSLLFSEGMPELLSYIVVEKLLGKKGRQAFKKRWLSSLKDYYQAGLKDFPMENDTIQNLIESENHKMGSKRLQISKFPLYLLKFREHIGDNKWKNGLKRFIRKNIGLYIEGPEDFYNAFPNILDEQKVLLRSMFSNKFDSYKSLILFFKKKK